MSHSFSRFLEFESKKGWLSDSSRNPRYHQAAAAAAAAPHKKVNGSTSGSRPCDATSRSQYGGRIPVRRGGWKPLSSFPNPNHQISAIFSTNRQSGDGTENLTPFSMIACRYLVFNGSLPPAANGLEHREKVAAVIFAFAAIDQRAITFPT